MPGFEIIGQEELDGVKEALSKKILLRYEHGESSKVLEFEKRFADFVGAKLDYTYQKSLPRDLHLLQHGNPFLMSEQCLFLLK